MPRRSSLKPLQPCQSMSCLLSWQLAQGTGTERAIWRDREREWSVGNEANTERGIEILREGKATEDMKKSEAVTEAEMEEKRESREMKENGEGTDTECTFT